MRVGQRRQFIKKLGGLGSYLLMLGSGILKTTNVGAEWLSHYFAYGSLSETLNKMYHDRGISESDQIIMKLPKIAENGAVVPISVSSTLPNVSEIAIFVEKNPAPLSANFKLSPNLEATVSARIKMAESSNVIAIVTSEGKLFKATQEVQVTIGGCGG